MGRSLAHLHSSLVLLKGMNKRLIIRQLIHLHSSLVLLKVHSQIQYTPKYSYLHSSLVLLKVCQKPLPTLPDQHLHSSLVLLKEVNQLPIMPCTSIYIPVWFYLRLEYHRWCHQLHQHLHSSLVLLKVGISSMMSSASSAFTFQFGST